MLYILAAIGASVLMSIYFKTMDEELDKEYETLLKNEPDRTFVMNKENK